MFKKLTLLILLSISLFAGSPYLNEVYSYDKQMSLANDSSMLRIFHSLQNIYIKSIIGNDDKLKIEALKRLIKCSKILKINANNYEKELSTLVKKEPKQIKKIKYKKVFKKQTINNKTLKINSISVNNKNLTLLFNKNIALSNIKSFALKSKRNYRKIFDISAILSKKPKIKTPKILNKIRIAQYDRKITRIVLESKSRRDYYLEIFNNKIVINFYKQKKDIQKVFVKQKFQRAYFTPKSKIIVLDPGHGGKDTGAIGYQGRYEKRAVLKIALRCAKELRKRGYKVYLTRQGDYFVTLRNRTKFANRKNADLFISIHANASPRKKQYLTTKGLETYFLSPARSKRSKSVAALENRSAMKNMDYYSKNIFLNVMNREKIIQANKMALDVQQGILKSLRRKYNVKDGGVREAPFWVLVGAQMPAILIETGFITNPTEGIRLFNPQYEKLIAKGIANGVDSYFLKN